jgi:alpha-tubulin suppressor-like RCC1 family protein
MRRTIAVLVGVLLFAAHTRAQSAGGGSYHTTIAESDGSVWSWGYNGNGQLGDGTLTQRVLPVNVSTLSSVLTIASGNAHSLAVKSDGTLWAWGYNGNGQLGDGSLNQHTSPVQVTALSGIIAAASGYAHSLALKSDGTVWAWGLNSNGQLGDNTTTQHTSPVQVSTLSGIVAIAAGDSHSLAVKSDGTVWAWGYNGNNQLGDGTNTQRPLPVQVSGLTGVIAVAAGSAHSLALKSDGSVKAWGFNGYGQLGDSTTAQRPTPVSATNLPFITAIAAGAYHTLAIAQDSSVWAWGNNFNGELGDGTGMTQPTPVAVTTVSNILKVDAGNAHSVAIATDGTVWAWGQNTYAQIGDGTTVRRLLPVKVSEASYAWKVGTPTFSVAAGTYTNVLNVTVATATAGATIHYTTNGVEPSEADPTLASGSAVSVTQSLTLKAKAWKSGIPASNVDGNTYTLKVFVNSLSPNSGTYNVNQNVSATSTASGATLHYTTNGNDPTEADPVVSNGIVAVTQSLTLKVKGWKSGWTVSDTAAALYTMKVGTPGLSPSAGAFTSSQNVTVTDVTPGATLRYTTSGLEPTTTDPVVTSGGTIAIGTAGTLRVKGWQSGWTDSDTVVASYTFTLGTVATPIMTPGGGSYTSVQAVALSTTTTGATIRYTLDGTNPNLRSPVYSAPIAVSAPSTIKAVAFKADWAASAVASASYAFDFGTVDIPTLVPPGGSFPTMQTVTISTTTAGATIHYTTTGLDPTESDAVVVSGGTVTVPRPLRLKVKAWKTGSAPSAVRVADYGITGAVAAGAYHTLALKADGTVWSWGYNASGQLGDGSLVQRLSPVQVSGLTDVVAIAAGSANTSLALKRDGTVWGWGENGSGQLGDGTQTSRSTPVRAGTLTGVIAIAVGGSHSFAVKSDGTLWAWGANSSGQLGDGTQTQRTSPVQITALTGVSMVAAGYNHSVALKTDGATAGTVWTWGYNNYGQLADGAPLTLRKTPATILANATGIGAGDNHSLAIVSDGTSRSSGLNGTGQLGDGTAINRGSPVTVIDLSDVAQIDGGAIHSLAMTRDGSAWAWGHGELIGNPYGANGNNNTLRPQRVAGAGVNVLALSAGSQHSVVANIDGTVWAWGVNGYGELGNGTLVGGDLPAPVPGFSLVDASWLIGDPDGDSLPTWKELQLGTDPLNPDTNGDGVRDGAAASSGVSATSLDTDGDGVPNIVEITNGTDPLRADTDGDGVDDLHDCFPLDPGRSSCGTFDPNDHTPPAITLTLPTNAVPVP